jgi:N-acetylmuramoyl-L-alanine amidase
MHTRSLFLAVVGCLLAVAAFWPPLLGLAQEPVASVTAIRLGQEQGRTRLVLELDKPVEYRWFTLPTPPRMVVDFPQVEFANRLADVKFPVGSMVKAARAGNFRPGVTRMVLDLEKPARISLFTIPGNTQRGPRLVVDVIPPKPGQPATDKPPPEDVVTQDAAPPAKPEAPVVPKQVVTDSRKDGAVVVVLDAGHGGVDPGACGKTLCEKNLTLTMVKMVKERLEKEGHVVKLSRDRDVFVPLAERVKFAQRNNANLFVSLHADSHPDKDVKGATVYMVSEKASDREAQRLANSENEGDILAGVDLSHESKEVQNILVSLAQRDTMNHSSYLGQSVLSEMADLIGVRKSSLLFAGFKVLKAPDVPSILVEMGYLSNPSEERQLANPKHREKLADAIAEGIDSYIKAQLR